MRSDAARTHAGRIVGALLAFSIVFLPSVAIGQRASEHPELAVGEGLMSKRLWDDAEDWFYDFVKEHPGHAEALRKLGLVELRRPGGDVVRAKQYLERARRAEPESAIGLFLVAKAYEASGETDKAVEFYQQLVDMGPGKDDPLRAAAVHVARFNRALHAELAGDADTARELFRAVLGREPQHAYATYELGLIERHAKNLDLAQEWLGKAVRNVNLWAPMESWPYPQTRYGYIRENAAYELALTQLEAGKPAEAKETLAPVLQTVMQRSKTRRRHLKPPPKAPLEGDADLRFENTPLYYAEALVALGEKKEARKLFKEFSRFKLGDRELRARARQRMKETR